MNDAMNDGTDFKREPRRTLVRRGFFCDLPSFQPVFQLQQSDFLLEVSQAAKLRDQSFRPWNPPVMDPVD